MELSQAPSGGVYVGEILRTRWVELVEFGPIKPKNPVFFANFSMRTNFGVLRPFSGLKHFVLKFSTLVEKCLSP